MSALAFTAGCKGQKVAPTETCDGVLARAKALTGDLAKAVEADGGVQQPDGKFEQAAKELDDELARGEVSCADPANTADLATIHTMQAAVRKWRETKAALVKSDPKTDVQKSSPMVSKMLSDPTPPLASKKDEVPALTASLKTDKAYATLWNSKRRDELNDFLTLLSHVFASAVHGGLSTVLGNLDAVLKSKHLFDAMDHINGVMLRTGAFPDEFADPFKAHLTATRGEPHMGVWKEKAYDYSALAAWFNRDNPAYVRELLAAKTDGPAHWSNSIVRDQETGKKALDPLRFWLARESPALVWLGTLTHRTPEENARYAELAKSYEYEAPDFVNLTDLLKDYGQNELRADTAYKGKVLQFVGYADAPKRGRIAGITVNFAPSPDHGLNVLMCSFDDTQAAKVSAFLSKGDQVGVRGRIDGLIMTAVGASGCDVYPF